MYDIEYFTIKNKTPVYDFIKGLTPKEQAKILREIDLLGEFGFALGLPHIKKIQGTKDRYMGT